MQDNVKIKEKNNYNINILIGFNDYSEENKLDSNLKNLNLFFIWRRKNKIHLRMAEHLSFNAKNC